jgi:preprotein translocase subunit SecE
MAQLKLFRFFDEVKREAKKISWPGMQETRVSTIMVFIMATIVGCFLFAIDQLVNTVIQLILGV